MMACSASCQTGERFSNRTRPTHSIVWISSWFTGLLLLAAATAADKAPAPSAIGTVSALGRLEPLGGVIHVSAPHSLQGPSILAALLVAEGQSVTNAQPLARTHTHAAMKAAWEQARRSVESAQARLDQSKAGLKPAELQALAAETRREQSEFSDAEREFARLQRLLRENAVSQQALDEASTRLLSRSNSLQAARHRESAGNEVRPVDVAVALAELRLAEAQERRAHEEFLQTIVLAPQEGEILAIHAHVGEVIGPDGLLDLGTTSRMSVKAEIYETDIRHVRAGQMAEITGEAFEGKLTAKVLRVGRRVRPNRLLNPNPSAFTDSRIVETILVLDTPEPVAGLSGALVNVRIRP